MTNYDDYHNELQANSINNSDKTCKTSRAILFWTCYTFILLYMRVLTSSENAVCKGDSPWDVLSYSVLQNRNILKWLIYSSSTTEWLEIRCNNIVRNFQTNILCVNGKQIEKE
jgi:hypothetical protein